MRLVPRLQLLQPNNFDNMPEWMDFFFWNLKFFENFWNFFLKIYEIFFESLWNFFWKFMKICLKIFENFKNFFFENLWNFFWKFVNIFLKICENFRLKKFFFCHQVDQLLMQLNIEVRERKRPANGRLIVGRRRENSSFCVMRRCSTAAAIMAGSPPE